MKKMILKQNRNHANYSYYFANVCYGLKKYQTSRRKMLEQYLASMQKINKATTTSLENVLEGNAKSLQLHAGNFNLRNILVDPTTEPYLNAIAAYRDVNPNTC